MIMRTNRFKQILLKIPFSAQVIRAIEIAIPKNAPLPAKVLKYTCLTAIIASLGGITMNFILGFPPQLNLIIAACTLGVVWLFIKLPLDSNYNRSGLILILLELLTLSLNWFASGGMYSSGPYFIIILICFSAIIMTGAYLWWTVSICIANIILLIALESYFPQWLTVYDIYSWRYKLDILFAYIMLGYPLAWFINFITKLNYQQFKRAEEASQAKSIFLSQLSHELRTPLNSVIGFSSHMLKKDLSSGQGSDFLKRINTNGMHLLALVNQILDLSLIETGKLDVTWQDIDLIKLLTEIEDVVSLQAQEKGLLYQTLLAPELNPEQPLIVYSDPNRIRQILINLIGNGIKYTQTGHVNCRLSLLPKHVQIEIEDSGQGIPGEEQKQIFEPFTRLEQHMHHEGTGMGLTISRLICQHLGCELSLSHSSEQGSVFTLLIPFKAIVSAKPSKIK